MSPSSHDQRHRTASGGRRATTAEGRDERLSSADRALLAAQSLAGNAAVASALGRDRGRESQATTPVGDDLLTLDPPRFDLQVPLGSFDHLLKGGRWMRNHREIMERFHLQQGVMPVAWTAGTGATAQERNTRWRVAQRTLVATSTLDRFAAVGASPAGDGVDAVTDSGALLAGLPRTARTGHGAVRVRYADDEVVGGSARVTSRLADEATLVIELAFAHGSLVLTGRRDVRGQQLDWDTELTIDLDALARVLWWDVFDRLETRRRGGVKKLKAAAAPGEPPRKKKSDQPEDDDHERIEPAAGTGEEQVTKHEQP